MERTPLQTGKELIAESIAQLSSRFGKPFVIVNYTAVPENLLESELRDLLSMVKEGKFREDLYHKLRVASIHIPPLRDKKKDILPLVHFFLNKYQHTASRQIKGMSKKFLGKLVPYD